MSSTSRRDLRSRSLRTLALGIVAALALCLPSRAADACSCARPFDGGKGYLRMAGTVFLARTVKVARSPRVFTFEVLASFKGKVRGKRFVLKQPMSPCDPAFQRGKVSFVIINKRGSAGLCGGNYALSAQLPDAAAYFAAAKRGRAAKPPELRAALAAIKGYLHDRKQVPLSSKTLPAKLSLRVGKTRLFVTRTMPKHGLYLDSARCVGRACLLSGRYPREGLVFSLLLERRGKKLSLIGRSVVERKSRR
ncbi:MAG: hypothetical protein KC503_42210 [Myxococcales bacterium]|nr:hypothetical protein [Myxococcales bacterium]